MDGGVNFDWDDTTYLTGVFNNQVSIFYDSGTDATYLGFYTLSAVPEPSTILLLMTGAALVYRRLRRK